MSEASERPSDALRRPTPGPLFRVVKVASWVELGLFAILLFVWLAPGMEHATSYAGLAHGLGFVALALLIWIAVLRHEAPYTLLAATLTPVGPVGSVVAIEWIERRSLTGPSASDENGDVVDTGSADGSEWGLPRRERMNQ